MFKVVHKGENIVKQNIHVFKTKERQIKCFGRVGNITLRFNVGFLFFFS